MSSDKGMAFYWGSYVHPAGEVYPAKVERTPLYSDRGVRWATDYRLHVKGDFISTTGTDLTPTDVTNRILQMDLAYNDDYKECGFLMDGGLTPHRMANDDIANLSGNQIIYRSWDHLMPTEYANTRSFSIIVRAIFLHASDYVMSFSETVTKKGTGGATWRLYDTADGPQKVNVLPRSKVFHVQSGTVVGTISRILPPPPLWPLEEQVWQRVIRYSNPKYIGNPRHRKPVHYRTDYTYFFERIGPDAVQGKNWYFGS